MEKITINKTYFKLQGESNFPPKNPTPQRNKVSKDAPTDWNGKLLDYDRMSYEEFQEMKKRQMEKELRAKMEEAKQRYEDTRKLEEISDKIMRGQMVDPIEKAEAQNFVTKFKKRWYK